MAHILTLIDGNISPRPGEAGVVLFLRSSESGYRGQASAIAPGGQVTRRLGSWVGTCPVAVSQAMYQWVTSAGWHQQQISPAPTSQYRPDQILSGPQEIQPVDWSSDIRPVFDLMLASFGPAPQPAAQPKSPEPPVSPPAQPSAPVPLRQEASSSREKELAQLLGSAVKMLRKGSGADSVYQALADGLVAFASDGDDLDEDLDDELDDELDLDEADDEADGDGDGLGASEPHHRVEQVRLRPLMPGELHPGLTREQQVQLMAMGDDRAREKMLRTMQRSEQAILRARQVASMQAQQAQAAPPTPETPAAPVSLEAPPTAPSKPKRGRRAAASTEEVPSQALASTPEEVSAERLSPIMVNGVPCLSVEAVSQLSGKSQATVRLWCRDGKLAGKAFQARVEGDKVDRWLIPLSSLEINGAEAQA